VLALSGFTGCLGAAGGVRKENRKNMVQTDHIRLLVLTSNDAVIFYFIIGN
jgi:hypothetical protein